MPFALFAAFISAVVYSAAAAVATAIAFAIAHPFLTAAIIAATAYLRNQAKKGIRSIDPASYRRSEPTAQTSARWLYGRARVGGVPIFVAEQKADGYKDLYMVYALSEGEIEGIERVYVNGKEMPIADDAATRDAIYPAVNTWTLPGFFGGSFTLALTQDHPAFQSIVDYVARLNARREEERTGQKWIHTRGLFATSLIEFHLHRGEADSPMNTWLRGRNVGWSSSHELNGVSAVGVRVRAVRGTDEWSSIPKLEFVVRGVKITEPDATEAVWTENAASIRRHWLINVRGLDADKIDLAQYYRARATCATLHTVPEVSIGDDDQAGKTIHASDVLTATFGDDEAVWPSTAERQRVLDLWNWRHAGADNAEIRYSINGVIEADLDDREVEDRMDFAWAGHAVEWGGKVFFYPGRETPADLTIGEDDVIAAEPPSWQIEPRLEEKISSVVAVVPQSAQHDWLEFSVNKVSRAGEEDVAPVDLGTLPLIAYPKTATRLMKIHLARANGGRTGTLTLTRGNDWEHFGIYPTRRLSLDLPSEGLTAPNRFFVLSGEFSFAGTASLEVQQEEVGTYLGAADIPLTFDEAGHYLAGVGLRIEPPSDVRMRYRRLSTDPPVTSVFVVYPQGDEDGSTIDVQFLQARVRTAGSEEGGVDPGPWNLSAVGAGVTFFAAPANQGLSGNAYQYQLRWVYPYATTEWAAPQFVGYVTPLPVPIGYGV